MKNNKPLIITLIIILSIFTIILSVLLGVLLTNHISSNIFKFHLIAKTDKIYSEEFLPNNIEKINISSGSSDILIKKANTEKIKVNIYGKNKSKVKVDVSNNILNVDYTEIETCIGICIYSENIEIIIPQDYILNSNIESKYGDIDVGDFDEGMLSIQNDSGDIDIGSIKNIKIDSRYGDIFIDNITNKLDLTSSSGDIEIARANILENSKIISNYGDIEIEYINDVYIDAKTDYGDIKIPKNNRYANSSLVIDSRSGDIEVGDD